MNPMNTRHATQRLTRPTYRADIDGLRAVAVLSVVIYHAFPSVLRGGFIGVDVFFVISGFLISSIIFDNLEHGSFGFREFYARRVRRIFPALLLVLFTSVAFGWSLLLADEYQALGKHVAAGAVFLSNFALWNESGYFDWSAHSKPLLHLWSLAIEEQFYLFWPPLLWLAYRRHKSFFALTCCIAIASFAINIGTVTRYSIAAYYSPLSRFWELMVGGILAYLVDHESQYLRRYAGASSPAGLLLIGTGLFFLGDDRAFPGWWALLPTIGTFLVLSAKPTAWLNRHVLGNRCLVWIGLISYPLYLWHWPLLYLGYLVGSPSRWTRLAAVAASVLLAAMTYVFVEKPIRRARRTGSALYLLAGMALCGFLGLSIYLGSGFGFRLPEQFNQFASSEPRDVPYDCERDNRSDFLPKCTTVLRRPAIFIWGDSHANRLAAGFIPLQNKGAISLLEVTGVGCPPLLSFISNDNKKCGEINDYALHSIRLEKPDIVVLHADWEAYDLSKLDSTVRQVKEAGAGDIVLLGPVPRWDSSLLRSLLRCWRPRSPAEEFPRYSKCGLDPTVPEADASLRQTARRLGIRYISSYQVLCNSEGCLTHVNDGGVELATYDYGHLSVGAAEYLVAAIGVNLFSTVPSADLSRWKH
jgi:peptidoglycan/LPS O-acetylase OafA/YrhL